MFFTNRRSRYCASKTPNFTQRVRTSKNYNCFNILGIHHYPSFEITFPKKVFEFNQNSDTENFAYNFSFPRTPIAIWRCLGCSYLLLIHQNIINKDHNKQTKKWFKHTTHQTQESCRSISLPKRNNYNLLMPMVVSNHHVEDILRSNQYLIETRSWINLRQTDAPCSWSKRLSIRSNCYLFWGEPIQFSVI